MFRICEIVRVSVIWGVDSTADKTIKYLINTVTSPTVDTLHNYYYYYNSSVFLVKCLKVIGSNKLSRRDTYDKNSRHFTTDT